MRASELRLLTDEELRTRLDEAHRELFNLRQEWHLSRLEDSNRVIAAKREVARIKTVLRERELAKVIEGGTQ